MQSIRASFPSLFLVSFTQLGHASSYYVLLELGSRHSPSLSSSVSHPFSSMLISAHMIPLPETFPTQGSSYASWRAWGSWHYRHVMCSCSLHPAVFLLDLLASPTSVSEFKEMTFRSWHQRTEEDRFVVYVSQPMVLCDCSLNLLTRWRWSKC